MVLAIADHCCTGLAAGGFTGLTAAGRTGLAAGGFAGWTGFTAGGCPGLAAGGFAGCTGLTAGGRTGWAAGGFIGWAAGGLAGGTGFAPLPPPCLSGQSTLRSGRGRGSLAMQCSIGTLERMSEAGSIAPCPESRGAPADRLARVEINPV